MAISDRITAITNHLTDDWNSIDRLGLHTNILPKEYTQVDYIESSGTQYINTGVNNDGYKSETEIAWTSLSGISDDNRQLIGNSQVGFWGINANGYYEIYQVSNYQAVLNRWDKVIYEINYDSSYSYRSLIVNENILFNNQTSTSKPINTLIYLFRLNDNSYPAWCKCKIKYYKIWDKNNVLVRDFIPCFRNTDNEVGLYDIVNNVFYTNQGTGVFTYGQIQEQHIDKNIENIKEPLDLFYNEVSDKTDISENGVVGRTSQETTTGKNLFTNALRFNNETKNGVTLTNNNDGSFTVIGTANANGQFTTTLTTEEMINNGTYLKAGTYYQQCATRLQLHDENGTWISNTWRNFTTTSDLYVKGMFIEFTNGTTYNDTYYYQIEEGSTATSYEEYTGNQPSPNPNYPQPINNLSGNVAYKVSGKNLFNENYYSDKTKYKKYGNYYAFAELPNYFKTKFYANVFLKGISNNLTICFNDSKSIPSNDKKVLDAGVINSNVEFDFTNAEKVYIGIGNGSGIDVNTDINNIFNNYNVMCTLSLDVPYEPYISQTFNIPLKSKNLFDGSLYNGITKNSNGTYKTTKYYTDATEVTYKGNANTQYTISFRNENLELDAGGYSISINGTWVSLANKMYTFTTDSNGETKIKLGASSYADIGNFNKYIQIEQGSASSPYEPYYDIELCKIDTYEDKIYSSDDRFYLNKKNGKYTFNSIVNAGLNTSGETSYQAQIGIIPTMKSSNWDYGYSNYFKRGTSKSNNIIRFGANDKYIYIYTNDSTFSITSSANTWISSHNIICYYILDTPTTTEITQENYPSLYNALKQIQDYLTAYKINKEFILGYSSPEIEY